MKVCAETIAHFFSGAEVRTGDYRAFIEKFDPAATPPAELRRQMGAVRVVVQERESDLLAACESPECRTFFQSLRRDWPHGFFYLSTTADTLKAYVYCLLSSVTVQRRVGVSGFSRNELFQIVGEEILRMEKTCALAAVSPSDFRQRSRLLLKHFDLLKR